MQSHQLTNDTILNLNQSTISNEEVESLISQAIEEKDATLLKKVCDLYKNSSQPMHPDVVKCHVIYLAINLELDIQNELEKWEEHLSKNSDSNLNVYLFSHFMPKNEQDLIKLSKAYRKLKDALTFFACYYNDEIFRSQLKAHCNFFQTESTLERSADVYNQLVLKYNFIGNSLNDNKIKILNNYINDHLWIIDEIPEEKTGTYKNLLKIKYNVYSSLAFHYDSLNNKSEYCALSLAISEFDATNKSQLFCKAGSLLAYCESKWIEEDNFSNKAVLENRQLRCKTAIEDFRKALNSSKNNSTTDSVLKSLIRCMTLYINYELLLNNNDVKFNKSIFYEYYKTYLEKNENITLDATIECSCKFIFCNINKNNIEETKKTIFNSLNCKTPDKTIKNKIKIIKEWIKNLLEFHSNFFTIENEYEALQKKKYSSEKIKEYKSLILKVNNFLRKLRNDPDMKEFKDYLENQSLFMDAHLKSNLAALTKDKENIESAKKALLEYNENYRVRIDINNYQQYKLIGINLYEIIPILKSNKKLFVPNSTESSIYENLTNYLLDGINIFMHQKLNNPVPQYDNDKSLSVNFLNNLEKIKNELSNNFVKKIDVFLVTETMLELFKNTHLKDSYNDLYDILKKIQLDNIKCLLAENETLDTEEKLYFYQFYIETYKSILYNVNEYQSDCINIFLKVYELIKTSYMYLANDFIDEAIDTFPNEIQFFKIKLSLLKNYDCPVVSDGNEKLTAPTLPEKKDPTINQTNKSKNHQNLENTRETAYKNLQVKREDLINCQKDYTEKEKDLLKLSEEIINLYESINQIDIEQSPDDVLINLKNNIKDFIDKNKAIEELQEEFQLTTQKLQEKTNEFEKAKAAYDTVDKKFNEFILRKEQEEKEKAEVKAKKEEAAKKAAEVKAEKARKDAEAKAKKEEAAKKAAEVKAEKARKDAEAKSNKEAEVKANKEAYAKLNKETKTLKSAEEAKKEMIKTEVKAQAVKAKNEEDITKKKAEQAKEEAKAKEAIADKARKKEDKAREEVDKAREEVDKAREELDEARKEEDNARKEVYKARVELDQAREELDKAAEKEDKGREEVEKTREKEDKARGEEEKAKEELDKAREEKAKAKEEKGDKAKEEVDGVRRLFLFYEEMKRFAIQILEGKVELVRPYIQSFYFALLLNEVNYRINRTEKRGYIPPSLDELREFSSECTNLLINNSNVLKNAGNYKFPFKRNIESFVIEKLNEHEKNQEYKDELHQPHLIQQQEYQLYLIHQFLIQQQQECQQFLIQQQQECQQFLIQQQQEYQPYLIQQRKCQLFLIKQQQEYQQFVIQQQVCQQLLIQQQQENQPFFQQFLLQQTQFYLDFSKQLGYQQQTEYHLSKPLQPSQKPVYSYQQQQVVVGLSQNPFTLLYGSRQLQQMQSLTLSSAESNTPQASSQPRGYSQKQGNK